MWMEERRSSTSGPGLAPPHSYLSPLPLSRKPQSADLSRPHVEEKCGDALLAGSGAGWVACKYVELPVRKTESRLGYGASPGLSPQRSPIVNRDSNASGVRLGRPRGDTIAASASIASPSRLTAACEPLASGPARTILRVRPGLPLPGLTRGASFLPRGGGSGSIGISGSSRGARGVPIQPIGHPWRCWALRVT
jgi:hypothetical protein